MKTLKIFLFLAISLCSFSCIPKLKVHNIQFDEHAGFYKYRYRNSMVSLRMPNGLLVERDSLKSFLISVANNDMHYSVELNSENPIVFLPEEQSMVNLYNEIQNSWTDKNPFQGLVLISEFEKIYPNAFKFTDIDFIKAKLWEQLSNQDSANVYYKRFLLFSEKKYSSFFRGYENDEKAEFQFIDERIEAANKLSRNQAIINNSVKNPSPEMIPKYYYQSFSQGFVYNKADFGNLKKNNFALGIEYNDKNQLNFGIGNTWLMHENYIYGMSLNYVENKFEATILGSFQIYKSKSNSFGFKITPSVNLTQFSGKDSLFTKKSWFNPGLGISMGYRFNQRWYFGASYTAYLFNQYTHNNFDQKYYLDNRYDLSLYYQLIKGISLKAGIDSGYPVIGFGLLGSSLGYFFKNRRFGIRMNHF